MKKYRYTPKRVLRTAPPKQWNKKGQFFLIAAVVTIMVLFTLTAKYNTIRQSTALQDFKELSEGYTAEQPKVVNLAIAQNQNEALKLREFTKKYATYAQGKEPSYGILYAYRDSKGNIHVVNSLQNKAINIEFTGIDGKDTKIQLIGNEQVSGSINLDIGGQTFGTTVKTDVANFGEGLTQADDLRSISSMKILIGGRKINLEENFEKFKNEEAFAQGQTYVLGEEKEGNHVVVKATLTGFAVNTQEEDIYTDKCGQLCFFSRMIVNLAKI